MCCSVLQCVVVCCSVLQCVAMSCSVAACRSHCVTRHDWGLPLVSCPPVNSILSSLKVSCSELQWVAVRCIELQCDGVAGNVLQDTVLQCVAVCCSVLQCVAVCCSVLQDITALCYDSLPRLRPPTETCHTWTSSSRRTLAAVSSHELARPWFTCGYVYVFTHVCARVYKNTWMKKKIHEHARAHTHTYNMYMCAGVYTYTHKKSQAPRHI